MTKSKVFIGIAISFALGVTLASKVFIFADYIYIFLGICAVAFTFLFICGNKTGAIIALFLFCAALGVLRLQAAQVPNEYKNFVGNKQQWEGYITEDVNVGTSQQTVTFRPNGFSQDILITESVNQKLFYGDWVVVTGKPSLPKNYGDFDYQSYLQRFNTYALMSYPQILILKSNKLNPVKHFLLEIKQGFTKRLAELLPEPQNSLAVGILIGGHGNLPKNIVNNFNATGVSHIIAVSGFNITIIIVALASLAYVVGRRASFYLALSTIAAFVIITGASASVLRAAIMGFLLLLAVNIGRQYSITPALFFAASIMLIANPKILFWDVGFQLSFAATLGIVYFSPVLEKIAENLPKVFGAKSLILTTLSAIIATMPLILFNFGNLSLAAPLVNLLILPVVPLTMLFGFLAVLPLVGPGFAFVANLFLTYILKVTAMFASILYANLAFQISVWLFWVLATGVFGLYFLLKWFSNKKSRKLPNTDSP